jgi:putative FmdB family regulatory protein
MPTYSYRCTVCGTAFDIQQAFTDDSLTECPQIIDGRPCGGKLRKLFSAVGVSFSGSGFYRNDSRAAENKSAAKKDAAPSESAPAAAAPKESTPAAASTPAPAPTAAPAKKD